MIICLYFCPFLPSNLFNFLSFIQIEISLAFSIPFSNSYRFTLSILLAGGVYIYFVSFNLLLLSFHFHQYILFFLRHRYVSMGEGERYISRTIQWLKRISKRRMKSKMNFEKCTYSCTVQYNHHHPSSLK